MVSGMMEGGRRAVPVCTQRERTEGELEGARERTVGKARWQNPCEGSEI